MKKYVVELIGAFFLMLTLVLASNNPAIALQAPLAVGAMYMAMIYAGGHISGAHFNPAVTLAVFMRGKMERQEAGMYVLAQVIGAVAAAAIGTFLHGCGGEGLIILHSNFDPVCSILAEFLGTFALAYVVLNVATTESNAGNSHYGLAIGFTSIAAAYGLGSVSGGAFNPALAIGGALSGMFASGDLWIYLVGTLAGAAAAATVFALVYGRGE